ncbi:hypothetical protein ACIBBE_24830 [Streptomyces sp. NPDC051644]|uniref:hypothetical protein n=1 Tax=Streptomyces sp. NPDC051644 TaxID=3365666 RepID=UPI003798D2B1
MSTTELGNRLLDQGLAALSRSEAERQYLDLDLQLLTYTAMTVTLAGISTRLLTALSRHQPELAQRLADEILDLRDEPQEMADYLQAQASAASPRSRSTPGMPRVA